MSRSLGKIIDIIKAEKEISESDHNSAAWETVYSRYDLKRFVQKYGGLSRTQYLDLVAGDKIEEAADEIGDEAEEVIDEIEEEL